MNQLKISLADLLFTVIALVVFGLFCFLSFNFLYLGETKQSILWVLALVLPLGFIAFVLKLLKKTRSNFSTCHILEWVLMFLFVVIALIAVFPFSHYFAVLKQKEEIQTKITANIQQAENMFEEYELYSKNRENNYKGDLESAVRGKEISPSIYEKYGFIKGTDDKTQIKNKLFALHAQLFPSNFLEMKQVYSKWLAKAKNTSNNWNPLGVFTIVEVVNEVSINAEKWLGDLRQFSAFRAKGEASKGFDYSFSFDDVKSKFTKLGQPTLISISLAIAMYLLMLVSYFISSRSPKSPVGKKRKESEFRIDY